MSASDRPSDRAVAEAFHEAQAGKNRRIDLSNLDWIEARARELDRAAPEAVGEAANGIRMMNYALWMRGNGGCEPPSLWQEGYRVAESIEHDTHPPVESAGFVLVPREPTEAMLRAGADALANVQAHWLYADEAKHVYAAMIAASTQEGG